MKKAGSGVKRTSDGDGPDSKRIATDRPKIELPIVAQGPVGQSKTLRNVFVRLERQQLDLMDILRDHSKFLEFLFVDSKKEKPEARSDAYVNLVLKPQFQLKINDKIISTLYGMKAFEFVIGSISWKRFGEKYVDDNKKLDHMGRTNRFSLLPWGFLNAKHSVEDPDWSPNEKEIHARTKKICEEKMIKAYEMMDAIKDFFVQMARAAFDEPSIRAPLKKYIVNQIVQAAESSANIDVSQAELGLPGGRADRIEKVKTYRHCDGDVYWIFWECKGNEISYQLRKSNHPSFNADADGNIKPIDVSCLSQFKFLGEKTFADHCFQEFLTGKISIANDHAFHDFIVTNFSFRGKTVIAGTTDVDHSIGPHWTYKKCMKCRMGDTDLCDRLEEYKKANPTVDDFELLEQAKCLPIECDTLQIKQKIGRVEDKNEADMLYWENLPDDVYARYANWDFNKSFEVQDSDDHINAILYFYACNGIIPLDREAARKQTKKFKLTEYEFYNAKSDRVVPLTYRPISQRGDPLASPFGAGSVIVPKFRFKFLVCSSVKSNRISVQCGTWFGVSANRNLGITTKKAFETETLDGDELYQESNQETLAQPLVQNASTRLDEKTSTTESTPDTQRPIVNYLGNMDVSDHDVFA